jgi:hypothetical protein
MSHSPSHQRTRFVLLVAALVLGLFAAPGSATPVVDDALQAATCTGLLDGVADTVGDVTGLVDPSSCYQETAATTCAPAGTTCETTVEEENADGTVQVDVTGTANPGGFMALAISRTSQTQACGLPLYAPVSIQFESQGVSDLVATHRISKARDHEVTQNGADNVGVCYSSPKAFTDTNGNSTTTGLLPPCEEVGSAPPCIVHRLKNKADALVKMLLPEGDPVWKMVEETIDERTG